MIHQPTIQRPRRAGRLILTASIAFLAAAAAQAVDEVAVPRSELEQMRKDMAAMRREIDQLKTDREMAPKPSGDAPRGSTAKAIALLNQRVDEIANAAELSRPGETKMHLAGSASATFSLPDSGSSNFSATFSPIFLWQLNKSLLFEGEVEFELEDHDTVTKLEYAQLDWSLTDNLTLVAGKFLNPMNVFVERYEPKWINKLPDTPLAIYDGILPESNVGFQLRGVLPIAGAAKVNFAAYVSNAPSLITDDPEAFGQLDFDNFSSLSDNKAIGGRVGLQFCPNFEIGYGVQHARVQGDTGPSARALQQSVDVQASLDALKGHWTLLGQYAWSDVGGHVYDADGSLGFGPADFKNHRNGGYAQLSYRGKTYDSDFLNRLEVIVRADRSESPRLDPNGGDEKRLTFGLDYWLTGSTALKAAYEITHDSQNGEPDHDTFLFGIATGL